MIIEATANETTVVSNFTVGEVIPMSISTAGQAHAMSTLSNMYNDPNLAVIREYFANGLDSHVMAGQTAPVEISLPNEYNKMYVVKDSGTGMSLDTIREVYSKYWESTKRESNNQIGAFGLGAKSALAIAQQFTVTSVKDGVKATVLIQKSVNGSGIPTINVVAVNDTLDANGVTVSIPVTHTYAFNAKAREFFKFVDPSKVTVDGYAPTSIFDTITKLEGTSLPNAEIFMNMDESYGTSYVVMGEVAYALTDQNVNDAADRLGLYFNYQLREMPIYFKVGIGDVNLTPNREGLLFDEKTSDLLDAMVGAFLTTIKATAQAELDAVDDRFQTYSVAKKWEERLGTMLEWRGEKIRTEIHTKSPSSTIKRTHWDKSSHGNTYSLSLNSGNRDYAKIVVTGQPFDKYRRMSNYITDYMAMMGITGAVIFYFREALDELDTEWISDNPNFTFENFEDMIQRTKDYRKAERAAAKALLPKAQRGAVTKLEYPVLDVDERVMTNVPYDEIPADSFYVHADDLSSPKTYKTLFEGSYAAQRTTDALQRIVGEGATVVFIAKNRSLESFKARTKNIHGLRSIRETFPEVQERINELMTEEVLRVHNRRLDYSANRYLARLSQELIAEILDDEVRDLLTEADPTLVDQADTALRTYQAVYNFGFIDSGITLPEITEAPEEVDTAVKYPLTAMLGSFPSETVKQHMIQYINMVYTDQLTLVDA